MKFFFLHHFKEVETYSTDQERMKFKKSLEIVGSETQVVEKECQTLLKQKDDRSNREIEKKRGGDETKSTRR